MKQYTQQQIKFISENFQQGQRAIQLGNFSRAEKHYLDILRIDPKITDAKNALAFVYTISKQHTKAIKQLRDLLKVNPNDANVHHNLANNLAEEQQYDEAINHYQTAIKLNPNFADSYTQCGLLYRKRVQFDSAIQHLTQALKLETDNPKILHALGITYADNEDYTQALKLVSRAVKLAPNNMEFNLALGKILELSDFEHEADIQYHHTCNTFPDYLEAFLAYGELLHKNRYYDEALECFEHALKLAPLQTDILDSLGNIYIGLANVDKAIDQFNLALRKEPKRISSLVGIEQAYQESGKEAQAITVCDRIIALDAKKPTGYVLKSKVKKSTFDDGLAEQLLNLNQQSNLTDDEKISINFALGKIHDDQKNYADAFKYYAEANALKAHQLKYDITAFEAEISTLIDFFTPEFFKTHQHLGCESNLPIIIVGMPRSGTTLTEQIISSHHDVIGAGEVTYWTPVTKGIHKIINTELSYPKCLNLLNTDHAKEVISRYESTLRKISGPPLNTHRVTDKMPQNFLAIGLMALLFPNVKIIHTKRDPIDTCLSIFFQYFNDYHAYSFDLENLGRYYTQYQRLMQHWHHVLPGRIMDINYSDTITDPEYWSRQLISNIGLEWDDACLAPHKLERSVKTASHWQVRQPIYKTSVERWKNYEQFLQPLKQALGLETVSEI